MPKNHYDFMAVCVDGETKTGKGAAGKAIAAALKSRGRSVYYGVAGEFYRRYVALVRQELGLADTDALPTGRALEAAARALYKSRRAFELNEQLGDLQRSAISQSVAVLAELPLVQQAGAEWWAMTVQGAKRAGADILVVDGRNPRARVEDAAATTGINVHYALVLYMTCEPTEAARRALRLEGIVDPSEEELNGAAAKVTQRRMRDRVRLDMPFIVSSDGLPYDPKEASSQAIIRKSWAEHLASELPITITLDNTHLEEPEMLAAVSELAIVAVEYIK